MTSPLFRVIREEKRVEEVPDDGSPEDLMPTTFGEQGFSERDIEDWLEKAPRLLGEDLLIIQRQANPVDAGNLWPDLVAVDRQGALVIVELKQDWSGDNVYWQAVLYAAAYWKRCASEIIDLYSEYLHGDRAAAVERLKKHIGSQDEKDLKKRLNNRQRIVLVSREFYMSATTAVLWLRDHGLDVSCLKLTPYLGEEAEECYVSMTELVPELNSTDKPLAAEARKELLIPLRNIPNDDASAKLDSYRRRIRKFSWSVAAKLGDLLAPALVPPKTSYWASRVGDSRYFGFWYNHEPWNPNGFSFAIQVRVTEEGTAPFRVAALFQFHEDTARQGGVTEENIEELRKWMRKFTTASFGCTARELPDGWYEVNKTINVTLDREGAEQVAEMLATLVHDLYPRIEKTLGRHVPYERVGKLGSRPTFQLLPDENKAEDLTRTTFVTQGFSDELDRHDWLVSDASLLGEDLLVIQRDHCDMEGLRLWLDVLAVDRSGALVAVEIRLDWSGDSLYWEAPLHGATCSSRTPEQVIDLYEEYLGGDRTAAVEKLKDHTGSKDEGALKEKLNHRQRVLLVASAFAKEVTTTALWLQEHKIDVSCLQLTPYLDEETGECYVDRTNLLERDPEDLLTGLRVTQRQLAEHAAELHGLEGQDGQITKFSRAVADKVKDRIKPELWPSEADKLAQSWYDLCCFGLWRPGSPWFWFYIFVRVPKDERAAFRVTLLFQFSRTAAHLAGVSEESIRKLRGLTATFAEKPGWNARPTFGYYYEAGKTVHVALDEAGAELAAETLAEVIREMYPRIKRVLDKDAAKRSDSGAPG